MIIHRMRTPPGSWRAVLTTGVLALAAGVAPAGQPERGARFDGGATFVRLEAAPSIRSPQITVASWVKLNSHRAPQILINRGERPELLTLYVWQDRLRMLVEHQPGSYRYATAALPATGRWAHVAGAYDGQVIRIYVDGRLQDETEAPGAIPERDDPLYIGARREGLDVLDGELADVRLYPSALSAEQAAELHRRGRVADVEAAVELDAEQLEQRRRSERPVSRERVNGYRGIWFTLGQFTEHGDKYSGGLGTYTAKHKPLAVYAPQVDRTFFVYGGAPAADRRRLLAMASWYDHAAGEIPRPTIVHDKQGVDDPHDNPSLQLDGDGRLWVFVSGRGQRRPGFIYRSVEPYSTEAFEQTYTGEFTYPQPWWIEGRGFLHLFTRYTRGRELYFSRSEDGLQWTAPRKLAGFRGHYQVSRAHGGRVGTAFNYHPGGNVDRRTNLYYAETADMGGNWTTAAAQPLDPPLDSPDNAALVHDYEAEGRLVYLNDLVFDAAGQPVIQYVTSGGWQPGPENDPREWKVARWDGQQWVRSVICSSDHNYDMGSLDINEDRWLLIGPTETGPQPYQTGGEVAIWISRDRGRTWSKERQVTRGSQFNHKYVRKPVGARDPFFAFWADGNPRELSPSRLYFTDSTGHRLWRLPYEMDGDRARPELIRAPEGR